MRDVVSKLNVIGIDTSVVLFFLAMEVGHSAGFASIETLLMGVTMLMLLVLPYFLPSAEVGEASFAKWLVFRGFMMVFGLVCGLVLPESMRYLPMNLLILAGISSCFVQFYGLMRLRLAN